MTTRNDSKTSGNAVLDALRKKDAALKAAIATEKVRQQKRQEKDAGLPIDAQPGFAVGGIAGG